jgi:hypothetical protein
MTLAYYRHRTLSVPFVRMDSRQYSTIPRFLWRSGRRGVLGYGFAEYLDADTIVSLYNGLTSHLNYLHLRSVPGSRRPVGLLNFP